MTGQIIVVVLFFVLLGSLNHKCMGVFFNVKRKRLIKNTSKIELDANNVNIPKLNVARKKRLNRNKRD
ncbi:MAG: hypothetical protein AABZ74_18930 [Cyanobacteriota bacterium]